MNLFLIKLRFYEKSLTLQKGSKDGLALKAFHMNPHFGFKSNKQFNYRMFKKKINSYRNRSEINSKKYRNNVP